jgi:outer membrane protein OmpA-like peptidoglycan-associated protein
MRLFYSLSLILFFSMHSGAQNVPEHPATVPIYKVTVINRTLNAVNYQYRNGPTTIDFRGTVLLPKGKGQAIVESKRGRTDIDVHFEHLAPVQQFGAEYLTYVLWAVTPEGHVKNLGEIIANGSDKAHTHVTTDLQAFGLIVTAEPYSAVRLPSDVVVLENQVRPDTIGGTEPIQARYELMPRGTYTYTVPSGFGAESPKVSMKEYEELVELYQAQNAFQIAAAQGAAQYAPEVFEKARQKYESARQLQTSHAGRSAIVTAARDAAQTAEDARTLAAARKHDSEIASARSEAERQQQLRLKAEAEAQRARSEANDAQAQAVAASNALEAERNANRQGTGSAERVAPAQPSPVQVAPIEKGQERGRAAARAQLLSDLGRASLQALDSPRGLMVTVRDSDFQGSTLSATAAAELARLASVVGSHPGLTIDVEGNSDRSGAAAERFSLDRATAVQQALVRGGLRADQVTARGLGDSHPFGPNSTEQGKMDNRRVEIVIHGDAIGSMPTWDKPYPVSVGSQSSR